ERPLPGHVRGDERPAGRDRRPALPRHRAQVGGSGGSMAFKELRVAPDEKLRLADRDTGYTADVSKEEAPRRLLQAVGALSDLQSRLYAQDRWAVLAIFQAMDAAGKDSTIAHVMSGVNPQGCQVFAFKAPSPQELDHDFMWRTTVNLPERGRIGIFNRSYYEEVLVVR